MMEAMRASVKSPDFMRSRMPPPSHSSITRWIASSSSNTPCVGKDVNRGQEMLQNPFLERFALLSTLIPNEGT